jgi:hypothetical protein
MPYNVVNSCSFLFRCPLAITYCVTIIVNLGLLIVSCYQAWEARDIKSEFAESKWIGLAVFSMSQGFLTGIPIVLAVAKEQPETFYLTITLLIFVISMVVLLLIFLPKVVMLRRYNKMSVADQRRSMASSVKLSSGLSPDTASVKFRVAAATQAASEMSSSKKTSESRETSGLSKTSDGTQPQPETEP